MKLFLAVSFICVTLGCNSAKNTAYPDSNAPVKTDTVKELIGDKTMWRYYDANGTLHMNDELRSFFEEWKADSTALSSEFRKSNCEYFRKENNILIGMKKTDVEKYLGTVRSHHEKEDGSSTASYSVESGCYNPEYDCCWLEILFDKNGLVTETSEVCT